MKKLKKINKAEVDPITLRFWHGLSENPALIKLLNYLEQNEKGKLSEDHPESTYAHIQLERLGGRNGWNKLQDLLLNPPERSNSVTEKDKTPTKDFSNSYTD